MKRDCYFCRYLKRVKCNTDQYSSICLAETNTMRSKKSSNEFYIMLTPKVKNKDCSCLDFRKKHGYLHMIIEFMFGNRKILFED